MKPTCRRDASALLNLAVSVQQASIAASQRAEHSELGTRVAQRGQLSLVAERKGSVMKAGGREGSAWRHLGTSRNRG